MRVVTEALKARLVALGYPVDIGEAINQDPSQGYIVIQPHPGDGDPEASIAVESMRSAGEVRVKAVSGTTSGVLEILTRIRADLSPGGLASPLSGTGWAAVVLFERSEFVAIDPTTTITGTDRRPALGVDTYRWLFQPI